MTMPTAPAELLPAPEPNTVRAVLDPQHTYLREHRVQGLRVLPGVVCLELALRGAAERHPDLTVAGIVDAAWLRPVHGEEPLDALTVTFDAGPDMVDYTVTNRGLLCGKGTLLCQGPDRPPAVPLTVRDRISENTRSHLTRREIYDEFSTMGIDYGPYFRRITYVQRHEQLSLAWLSHNDGTRMDLVNLLDCSFQAGMAISIGEHRDSLMPYSMGHLIFHEPVRTPISSAFVLTEKHSPFRTSLSIYDEDYTPLISVYDLGVKPAI
jgi:hypothetical protein